MWRRSLIYITYIFYRFRRYHINLLNTTQNYTLQQLLEMDKTPQVVHFFILTENQWDVYIEK